MSAFEVFSATSHLYATPVNERFYIRIAAALAEKAAEKIAPRRILEVGAGTGAGTTVLRRYFPAAEILATDRSEEMLAYNRAKGLPGVTYAPVAAEEIGRLDRRFELIFGNICYHWFTPGTARLLAPLLDPGGVAAFSVPVTGPEKETGNLVLLQICRALGRGGRDGRKVPNPGRLRREFACFNKCRIEEIALREAHPPALWGSLLRARGSWAFLFGSRAALAEELWRKFTAGYSTVALYWHIALVVAAK